MANFAIVISEPETRKSYQTQVEQDKAIALIGKKINDEVTGDLFGLSGYTLKITGGSDKDGFPMHPSIQGQGRKRALLVEPPGFHPKLKGERRRKTVHGNTISESIAQINMKVITRGETPLEKLFGKKEPKPEVKEEIKPEQKPEEKTEKLKAETGGEGSTETKSS
jgi:small subunit ribosomal protein S6e